MIQTQQKSWRTCNTSSIQMKGSNMDSLGGFKKKWKTERLLLLLFPFNSYGMEMAPQPIAASADISLMVGNSPSAPQVCAPDEIIYVLKDSMEGGGDSQVMSLQELQAFIIGTIEQHEEKHAATLHNLQSIVEQHEHSVADTQSTAQSAQSSSKYAVYVAIVTGITSVVVCVVSSVLSHYL